MKVYVLKHYTVAEYDLTIDIDLFSSLAKAREAFDRKKDKMLRDWEDIFDEEEYSTEKREDRFEMWEDGNACENSEGVSIVERKLDTAETDDASCSPMEVETIQFATGYAFKRANNHYEDSFETNRVIKNWALEFERWWERLTDDEKEEKDYLLSLDNFCEEKLQCIEKEDRV